MQWIDQLSMKVWIFNWHCHKEPLCIVISVLRYLFWFLYWRMLYENMTANGSSLSLTTAAHKLKILYLPHLRNTTTPLCVFFEGIFLCHHIKSCNLVLYRMYQSVGFFKVISSMIIFISSVKVQEKSEKNKQCTIEHN